MSKTNLYFIQGSEGSPVKIGLAVFPQIRLKELQTGNWDKLRILMLIRRCDRCLESILHKELSDFRINGEWFDAKILQDIDLIEDFIWAIGHGDFETIEYRCSDLARRLDNLRKGIDRQERILSLFPMPA
jgi:hypothetical protein